MYKWLKNKLEEKRKQESKMNLEEYYNYLIDYELVSNEKNN